MGVKVVSTPKAPDSRRRPRDAVRSRPVAAARRRRDEPRTFSRGPSLNLSIQEVRLVTCFRTLPDDERRASVLQALEAFCNAYI
mgnify:CR=1 FL=1